MALTQEFHEVAQLGLKKNGKCEGRLYLLKKWLFLQMAAESQRRA